MKIQNTIILLFVSLFAGFIHPQASFATWTNSGLTMDYCSGYSGDTRSSGCGSATCHEGHTNNTGGGSVSVAVKNGGSTVTSYTGGQSYTVEVTIAHSGATRWGFQTTAKKGSTNTPAGTFATSDSTTEMNLYSHAMTTNDYIQSSGDVSNLAGAKDGTANSATYSFTWTAPAAGTGTVIFYAAGMAVDGDSTGLIDTGDYPYTTTATLAEGSSTTTTTPTAVITANGSNGPLTISSTEILTVYLSLTAGSAAGTNGDWWLVGNHAGNWYYFDLPTSTWKSGIAVTYQAPLQNLDSYPISFTGLSGNWTFYFGVDTLMNGSLDMDRVYYDSVDVTAQ